MFNVFLGKTNCNWIDIPSTGVAGGLLTLWKSDLFEVVTSEYGIYSLTVKLKGKQNGNYGGSLVFTIPPTNLGKSDF